MSRTNLRRRKGQKTNTSKNGPCKFTIEQHRFLFSISFLALKEKWEHMLNDDFCSIKRLGRSYNPAVLWRKELSSCMISEDDGWFSSKVTVFAKGSSSRKISCLKLFWLKSHERFEKFNECWYREIFWCATFWSIFYSSLLRRSRNGWEIQIFQVATMLQEHS